uniref:Uncharacterized protein n=1 Tax=viral metagenome TaxID=1070528 RepID=A0A6C0BPG4_9ZZZZ
MACCVALYNHPVVTGVYNPPVGIQVKSINNVLIANIPIGIKFIPAIIQGDCMKYVIGTNGYYFNGITKASKVDYIWYHKEINMIEIRGFEGYMNDAVARINARMEHIKNAMISKSVDGNTETKNQKLKWADMVDDGKPFEFTV